MKFLKYLMIGALATTIFTGCSEKITIDAMTPPVLETSYELVNDYIEENLKDCEIMSFEYNDNKDNAILIDLDGDKSEEGIVFYKGDLDPENIHMIILKKSSDKMNVVSDSTFNGKTILKAEVHDIDADENKEIAIKYSSSLPDGFIYYEFQNESLNVLKKSINSDYFFYDLNGDGNEEYFVFDRGDRYLDKNGEVVDRDLDDVDTRVEMYIVSDDEMILIDKCNIEQFTNGVMWWKAGKITNDKEGIFLGNGIGNASYTSLLILNDKGKLYDYYYDPEKKVNEETFGKGSLPARDIDGDHIMEFAIDEISAGDENEPMYKVNWIDNWYKWDENNRKNYVMSTYYNYYMEILYYIPENMADNFKIDEENYDDKNISLKFSYYHEGVEEGLFAIYAIGNSEKDKLLDSGARIMKFGNRDYIVNVYENNKGISYDSISNSVEMISRNR